MKRQKTILITGASSGIGKETAIFFAKNGWKVIATMRKPEKEIELKAIENITIYKIDVTDNANIVSTINTIIDNHIKIDVLFNNAGYALVGAFEAMNDEQIKRQFETNVFGVMNLTRAILPHFRNNKEGIIISTTSVGGIITFPLYSVYHSTKWAVEGFMESLQYELEPFNIKIKNIEPGAIKTDFYERSLDFVKSENIDAYDNYVSVAHKNMLQAGLNATGPEVVAKKVFEAATDNKRKMRYPIGSNAPMLIFLKKLLPLNLFRKIVKSVVEKGLSK